MKIDKTIYENKFVKSCCERAQYRADDSGEDWAVYLDPRTSDQEQPRLFSGPSGDHPGLPMVCIFDTADGGRLL